MQAVWIQDSVQDEDEEIDPIRSSVAKLMGMSSPDVGSLCDL